MPDQGEDLPKLIIQPAANTAINNVQQQMLDILQVMPVAQITNNGGNNRGNNNISNNGPNDGKNGDNPRCRRNRRPPDNATFDLHDTSKYCHVHGAYNHQLGDCNRRAPGHRNAAILANRMGGYNAFCQPMNGE